MSVMPRLLIVEDDPYVRKQLMLYLEDFEEFRLASAQTGEEALQLLLEEPADLCLVDLRMPGMNGVDFIRIAQERKLCRACLVHTGVMDRFLEEELTSLCIEDRDIFFKPVDLELILQRARELAAAWRHCP